MKARGFTLIELVLVIVITGIMAAALTVFMKPAVEAYFDSRRRAGLTDSADTALRRIGRDIRSAVPNSIRTPGSQCFELVPTSGGGRYRLAPDTINDSAPGCAPNLATCSAWLDITHTASAFDTLSPLPVSPASGDWIVIGNQNTNDVYAGSNRAEISSVQTPNASFGRARLNFASTQFPPGYDGGRFTVVRNNGGLPAVFYICAGADGTLDAQGNGKGTIYRLPRAFDATYPAACPAATGASVLATSVKSCTFVYSPNQGATQQSGFVWMQIELAQGGETIALSYGAHVDNVP